MKLTPNVITCSSFEYVKKEKELKKRVDGKLFCKRSSLIDNGPNIVSTEIHSKEITFMF